MSVICRKRHWFTRYGIVGERTEFCVRGGCGARNPKFKEDIEPHYFEGIGRRCAAPLCGRGILAAVHKDVPVAAEEGDW